MSALKKAKAQKKLEKIIEGRARTAVPRGEIPIGDNARRAFYASTRGRSYKKELHVAWDKEWEAVLKIVQEHLLADA